MAKISDQIFAHNKDIPEIVNKKWPIFVGQFKMANDPIQGWDAMATANGEIYVNSDVLVKTKNDDQLAFILAHEISHICLNHNFEETEIDRNGISLSALTSMMLLVSMWIFIRTGIGYGYDIPKLTIMPFVLLFGIHLGRYLRVKITMKSCNPEKTRTTRMQEFEADELGLRLATKAGFDFRQAVLFYQKRTENISANTKMASIGYPTPKENLVHIIDLLPKSYELRTSCGWPELSKYDDTAEKLKTIINSMDQ